MMTGETAFLRRVQGSLRVTILVERVMIFLLVNFGFQRCWREGVCGTPDGESLERRARSTRIIGTMKILTNEMRSCRRGPEAWFTGTVWIDEIVTGAAPSRMKVNRVSFEPGARTAWHTHPVGQGLHVLSGLGRM